MNVNYFLIIETSGDDSFVALCMGHEVLAHQPLPPLQQSKFLLSTVQGLLSHHHLALNNLAFLAVGKGPGSFTGTRVGVMLAKTLSFAASIPIVPFCSLKRFTPPSNGPFVTLVDAKSRGHYALEGHKKGTAIQFASGPKLLTEAEIPKNRFILSPHALLSPNLPFIAQMVYDTFRAGHTASHTQVKVNYLI